MLITTKLLQLISSLMDFVDEKGNIEIPTFGKVFVQGIVAEQAKDKIQLRANDFLINSTC